MTETVTRCRACQAESLDRRLILPAIYPSLFTDQAEPPPDWPKVPLVLLECAGCGLVQLQHTFSPEAMYRTYWYKSALNNTMVSALIDVAEAGAKVANLAGDDTVVDIGCNDGTLLKILGQVMPGLRRIGVDPCRNLAKAAAEQCDLFINDFFGDNPGESPAKLITAIAMFYDLPDVRRFLQSVLTWLHRDGVLVIQMTDLYSMMRQNAFDNIVHEHLEYWSLKSLINACTGAGLDVFQVSENDVNGGSIRAFCCRRGARSIDVSVGRYLACEGPWIDFGWGAFESNLRRTIAALRSFLRTARHSLRTVVGIGASTKGNTLLQLLDTGPGEIQMIGEVSADKFGKHTVGTGIPILDENYVLGTLPDYVLVLPWHFAGSMKAKLKDHAVVLPMPVPELDGQPLW